MRVLPPAPVATAVGRRMRGSRPSRKSPSSHAVGRTPGARAAPGRRWWARGRVKRNAHVSVVLRARRPWVNRTRASERRGSVACGGGAGRRAAAGAQRASRRRRRGRRRSVAARVDDALMVLGAAVAARPRVASEPARVEGAGGQWHGASVAWSWRGACGGGGGEARRRLKPPSVKQKVEGGAGRRPRPCLDGILCGLAASSRASAIST